MGGLHKWQLSIDTFTHEVPSQSIEDLYYRTCKKLSDLYGKQVVTYRWADRMGYPGQVTIVQFKNEVRGDSYLVAGVFEANDNDSFWFSYIDGNYDSAKKEKRPNWELDGILRCNHSKSE